MALLVPTAGAADVNTAFEQPLRDWCGTLPEPTLTLHVDSRHPAADDTNPGSRELPLRTVQRGINLASPGVRVLIHPGIYRESLVLAKARSGLPNAPVVIEAAEPNRAIVSGAEVWTDWEPTDDPGVYRHAWPHRWGFERDHFAGAGASKGALGRRREMVFLDGELLRQVLREDEMEEGTYQVDEEGGDLYVRLGKDVDPESDLVEVAVREQGFRAGHTWSLEDWPNYFVLRGLTFRHFTGTGAGIHGDHFLVEGCRFEWNNGAGAELGGRDFMLRGNVANHNGDSGLSIPPRDYHHSRRALWEDNETSHNNWRGLMGDYTGFSVAGVKAMFCEDFVVRRHRSTHNETAGFWFDNGNRNILIEDCTFSRNRNQGLWIEISQGPTEVRGCKIALNGGDGVTVSNSSHLAIRGCTLYGNGNQIGSWSPAPDRGGFWTVGLTLRENVIACSDSEQRLVSLADYAHIYETIRSGRNLWWHPEGDGFWRGGRDIGFAGWLVQAGQDTDSLMADPRLRDPEAGDFTLLPDSPLSDRTSWGRRSAVRITPPGGAIVASANVMLTTRGPGPSRYTLDGSEPTAGSALYTTPLVLTESCVLKARAFGDEAAGGPISRAVFVVVPAPPPGPDVHLSDLPLLSGTVGWGGRPRADRTIMDRPLTILGTRYERGMGVHADSELIYALAPEYARFVAVAGVDDEVQEPDATSLAFQVFADDELLFESEVMGAGDPYVSISVELPKGAERLRLVVTDGGDGSHWDHADWASAGFVLRQ